jgi:hypothetical protein
MAIGGVAFLSGSFLSWVQVPLVGDLNLFVFAAALLVRLARDRFGEGSEDVDPHSSELDSPGRRAPLPPPHQKPYPDLLETPRDSGPPSKDSPPR